MILKEFKDTTPFTNYLSDLEYKSLFSREESLSDVPFLTYRTVENVFCRAFSCENLSRKDNAFDAKLVHNGKVYGIGIKTFTTKLGVSGKLRFKTEKVAEFNKKSKELKNLSIIQAVNKIATWRNLRITSTCREYGITDMFYHCVVRYHELDKKHSPRLMVKDFSYNLIDIENIVCTDIRGKALSVEQCSNPYNDSVAIYFNDGKDFYVFNNSKSVLLKKFDTSFQDGVVLDVKILESPWDYYEEIKALINEKDVPIKNPDIQEPGKDFIVLPLYAMKKDSSGALIKYVPEKSGLNQWNAGGRKRNFGEMYIPVPSMIRRVCAGFFPEKNEVITLISPNGKKIVASSCQGEGKSLMSNPNTALSEWFHPILVKDELSPIITYDNLESVGKDALLIKKLGNGEYSFTLSSIGMWEEFKENLEGLKNLDANSGND